MTAATKANNKVHASWQLVNAEIPEGAAHILSDDALQFIVELHRKFNKERLVRLEARKEVQQKIDRTGKLDFFDETKSIREGNWRVATIPKDLEDRRVEITGPVDRKMVINALNSGAHVFMADFEDSNTPSWKNQILGQLNLYDAVRRTITYTDFNSGKPYQLNDKVATIMVRPRGWHMLDKHLLVDGEQVSGSLLDFGLYIFHNAVYLLSNKSGPYFYLPKIEHYLEARLWNSVFEFAEKYLQLPKGCIKATVLIETIPAVFQLHEILWELKEHSAGLNCGRWDYIFSFIKKFKKVPGYIFPDRMQVTMTVPFMKAYTKLVVQTCHRRGIHAMGGMAAQIPIKNDELANTAALEKVRLDKLREVLNGHDGTWVAHPGLVSVAMEVFDKHMTSANQIDILRDDFVVSAQELLLVPDGQITEEGLRHNINVAILYIESWLRGSGAAAIYNMMEDAATAEISRTQVWQWLKYSVTLSSGQVVSPSLVDTFINEELEKIKQMVGVHAYATGRFCEAVTLFKGLVFSDECEEFLTTNSYSLID